MAAGTGTFSFRSYLTNSLSITQQNLLDTASNKATFSIIATCVPNDTDNDGVANQIDIDSDNDGIPDTIEAQGKTVLAPANADTNHDGIDNVFVNGLLPIDNDLDSVKDYLDLDSDNDGITDLEESGNLAIDANKNGIIDGIPTSFGSNGLFDGLETTPDNGVLNYTIRESDADGTKNYIDLDSDGDACLDVSDAGFTDGNNDGLLGNTTPPTVNANGLVTSGTNS